MKSNKELATSAMHIIRRIHNTYDTLLELTRDRAGTSTAGRMQIDQRIRSEKAILKETR